MFVMEILGLCYQPESEGHSRDWLTLQGGVISGRIIKGTEGLKT